MKMRQEVWVKRMSNYVISCWILLGMAACGSAPTPSLESTAPIAESVAIDSPVAPDTTHVVVEDGYEEPYYPPKKDAAEMAKLQKIWEDALAAERKFLVSDRLEEWMKGLKETVDQEDGMPIHGTLTDEQFKSLSSKERFGYLLVHPEAWSQNCAEYSDAAGQIQGISRFLPYDDSGDEMSERQAAAMRKDSNDIKPLILQSLATNKSVSIPMMRVISELKFFTAILPLVKIYEAQTTKDDLILTTLVELMERCNYWPWFKSAPCKGLLVDRRGTIPLTKENADIILDYAKKFALKFEK